MVETENETLATMDSADEESFVDIMDLEQTSESIALTLTPKNNTIGVGSTLTSIQVCATMKARTLPSEAYRVPVDILVALDVSGSMEAGDKLGLCKLTLELLLRHLLPTDRFGLITYSSDAIVAVPIQLMTSEKKAETLAKIKALQAGGGTNISAAIALSFQELRVLDAANTIQSVFLLTDGQANQGVTNPADLVELTRNCWAGASLSTIETAEELGSFLDRKPRPDPPASETRFFAAEKEREAKDGVAAQGAGAPHTPISLFCFGYGSDHNAVMLHDIASATESGSYYHVKAEIDVGSAFGDAMGGILSVVGQSAVLTLVPAEGVAIRNVHHDRAIPREHGTYTVSIGDFYAEEVRDVIVEVTLFAKVNSTTEKVVNHLVATLAYTDILRKAPVRSEPVICSVHRPPGSEVSKDHAHVTAQWQRKK